MICVATFWTILLGTIPGKWCLFPLTACLALFVFFWDIKSNCHEHSVRILGTDYACPATLLKSCPMYAIIKVMFCFCSLYGSLTKQSPDQPPDHGMKRSRGNSYNLYLWWSPNSFTFFCSTGTISVSWSLTSDSAMSPVLNFLKGSAEADWWMWSAVSLNLRQVWLWLHAILFRDINVSPCRLLNSILLRASLLFSES